MSQKKDNEIYDDEEQFISRKEFEIKRFNIWITYVFTLIFLIVFWSLFQNNPLIEEYLHINWRNIFSIIFYLSAYEMLLTAIEAYFYEKARFGEARIRGIVLDYSIFVLIFLLIGLWLMLDSNSLSKIVHFLVWFYTWNQK